MTGAGGVESFLFAGRLAISQPVDGYRFSVDSLVLARFLDRFPAGRAIDLGTGCGVVPLVLALRHPSLEIWGVELQEKLAALARENVLRNQLAHRVHIHCLDMTTITLRLTGGPVDLAAANPPFYPAAQGRVSPHPQRALARHEVAVTLTGVVAAGARMLRTGGVFAAIYPMGRKAEVLSELGRAGVAPKIVQAVIPKEGRPARFFLVAGEKGGPSGLEELPPFVIHTRAGAYTPQAAALFRR